MTVNVLCLQRSDGSRSPSKCYHRTHAKLTVLTRVLTLAQSETVSKHPDSKYAYNSLPSNAQIW